MKEDKTIRYTYQPETTGKEWFFFGKIETHQASYTFQTDVPGSKGTWVIQECEWVSICARQNEMPAYVLRTVPKRWWLFRDKYYYHSADIEDPIVIKGLILAQEKRSEKQRQKALRDAVDLDE